MTVWIGATHVISPLGAGTGSTLVKMRAGGTALRPALEGPETAAHFGYIPRELIPVVPERVRSLVRAGLEGLFERIGERVPKERLGCFLSTTKGDIEALGSGSPEEARLPVLADWIQKEWRFPDRTFVVSNACASGTSAISLAGAAIKSGAIDHAVVIGVDVLSPFVQRGFQALHALGTGPCRPFDRDRDGTSLGEACAALFMTNDRALADRPLGEFLSGAIAHDANHLSGPSRTGEGLVRAIQSALHQVGASGSDIHAINAHGTGTDYNDAMESIAFERCGLSHVPMSGYKGWFGHTLGAAGVLESTLALQALQEKLVLRNEGLSTLGVTGQVNALCADQGAAGDLLLKCSSGFGGCNSVVLLKAFSA